MEAWVLIWMIITGGSSEPVATHSQEFASKANCEFAMQQMVNMIDQGTLFIGCYPK